MIPLRWLFLILFLSSPGKVCWKRNGNCWHPTFPGSFIFGFIGFCVCLYLFIYFYFLEKGRSRKWRKNVKQNYWSFLQMGKQLESFKNYLEEFAANHKADIRKNPEFRGHFQKMCARIGVDPLACKFNTSSLWYTYRGRRGDKGLIWIHFKCSLF